MSTKSFLLIKSLCEKIDAALIVYKAMPDDGAEQDAYITNVIEPLRDALIKAKSEAV